MLEGFFLNRVFSNYNRQTHNQTDTVMFQNLSLNSICSAKIIDTFSNVLNVVSSTAADSSGTEIEILLKTLFALKSNMFGLE